MTQSCDDETPVGQHCSVVELETKTGTNATYAIAGAHETFDNQIGRRGSHDRQPVACNRRHLELRCRWRLDRGQ